MTQPITVILGLDVETDCGSWYNTYEGMVHGTPLLLDLFREKGVTGTFFVTGDALPLFFNAGERVRTERLEQEAPRNWESLRLIRPRELEFERDYRDNRKWRAAFLDTADDWYSLHLTDPIALQQLDRGKVLSSDCLLTLSLCEPWTPPDDPTKPPACYKLVAAVIELPAHARGL